VQNKVDGSWTQLTGSVIYEGLYVIKMNDNLRFKTCAPLLECIERDVGNWPSTHQYDPDYFEALQIHLESLGGTTSTDDDSDIKPALPQCFVATAAYDTPLAPNVQFLRQLRDQTLKKSRSGELLFDKFFEKYNIFAPGIVELMIKDPQMKELIKLAFVNPIINYFRIVSQFPFESLEELKEPWACCMDLR
jgi:hypothetical protein